MIETINTGERIILGRETPLMIARHLCAYKFAKDYVTAKTILDIGCGEGYGSYYLADFAKKVMGMDYDSAVVDYARNKYQKNNLEFIVMDVKDLCNLRQKFDVICSFQFIEHIKDIDTFLENIKGSMNNGGIFICSTPNKRDASPHSDIPLNKFHVKEYLFFEFKELLERYFRGVIIFGLRRGVKLNLYRRLKKLGLFNFLPITINPVKRFYNRIGADSFLISKDSIDTALDFIAVCRK